MSRLVLKASAGTGKTYRLSLEYLLSLYQGIPYSEIFVMTFTRKATAEIRERILEFSEEILNHSPKGQDLLKDLQNRKPDFLFSEEKLRSAYEAMIKNKEKIRIYTIDSFFQMIFHKIVCPCHQVYSMTMIETQEETQEYYKKILKQIFIQAELFQEMKEFFELSPEKDMEQYLQLLHRMVEERWKYLLLEKREKRVSFDVYKSWEEYSKEFQRIFRELEKIKKKEENYFTTPFFQDFLKASPEERKEKIEKNRDAFLDAKLFNGTRLRSKPKELEAQQLREQLVEGFRCFQEDLAKTAYDEMISYEEKLFSILEKIYQLYDEYKWQEKTFTHTDIGIYTYITLFQEKYGFVEEGKATDLLEESLDLKIHSLFLDEFQDTSILQWKILSLFLEKAKEVICVGDEKQSIYGWRGGEKALFENLKEILSKREDAREETLKTSYRSIASIVEFTNAIFSLYPKMYEEEKIRWNFQESKIHKQERGETQCYFLEEEQCYEDCVRLIQEKYSSHYGSLGVLARTNKILLRLANYLEQEKIPYQISTQEEHQEEELISSFLSLFRYFITEQYLYLLEFFRSPLIQSSNRILKKLLLQRESVIQYIHFGMVNESLPEECEKIRELYLEFQREEGKIGDSWLRSIQLFSPLQYFSKDKNKIAWYHFQEILSSYQTWEEYFQDLDRNKVSLPTQWEEESKNSVQLMTVHKSKGLEFENVIYLEPKSRNVGSDGRKLLFYCRFQEDYRKLESGFLTSARYKKYLEYLPSPFSEYLQEEKKKAREEELNTLYVALTRPKYNLHLFLGEKFEGREILEALQGFSAEHYHGEQSMEAKEQSEDAILFPLWKEKKNFLPDEKKRPQKYTEKTEWKRMEGIITHFFLEQLRYASLEEIAFARKKVLQEYANYFGVERLENLFSKERIQKILEKEPLIFSKTWDEIYAEYPIIDRETQKKYVIDRLMIQKAKGSQKGKILIVDYKTGGSNPEQLVRYANLVKQALGEKEKDYIIETKFLILGREGESYVI